jgi:hypothetical protein
MGLQLSSRMRGSGLAQNPRMCNQKKRVKAGFTADFCTLGGLLVFQGAADSAPPMPMKKPMVDGEALFIGFSWTRAIRRSPLLGPCKNRPCRFGDLFRGFAGNGIRL